MTGSFSSRRQFGAESDTFGLMCRVASVIKPDDTEMFLAQAMRDTLKNDLRTAKAQNDLAKQGLWKGICYETEIPVTGQGEALDRALFEK